MANKELHSHFGLASRKGGLTLKRLTPEQHIRQCVRAILLTHVGERRSNELGTSLRDYVYKPLTAASRREISNEVVRALRVGEPRIELGNIEVEQSAESGTGLNITLSYRTHTGTTDRLSLSV